jgi:hypothetical protein
LRFLQSVGGELTSSRPKRRFRGETIMKPIRDWEIDRQIRRTDTGFRTRALQPLTGEISVAWGSPFTGLKLKSYGGSLSSCMPNSVVAAGSRK